MSIKKITLTLDDKEVTLEWEEAKKLYEELYSIFGTNHVYTHTYTPLYVNTAIRRYITF